MSSAANEPPAAAGPDDAGPLSGKLHVYVAFDWGDAVDLAQARKLAVAEVFDLSRRPRTPTSIGYRPPPLRFPLGPVSLVLPEVGTVVAAASATVFDFGAASVALRLPFRLAPSALTRLAGELGDPATLTTVLQMARALLQPLFERLLPAIRKPDWNEELSEEYFVFQFPPDVPLPPERLARERAAWLAGLVRLEDRPLSADEVAEAVRLSISYSPSDLFLPDWAAAVLLDNDQECDETLQTVEFANLQLLEYRHIDNRLDDSLARADQIIGRTVRSRLPIWRSYHKPLRALRELKVEANGLFERTGNVLKLVGDQYLARVYRLLATRFHLGEWEKSIGRKLEVIEGVYEVVSDQTATYRIEFLEIIVIILIAVEIVMGLLARH